MTVGEMWRRQNFVLNFLLGMKTGLLSFSSCWQSYKTFFLRTKKARAFGLASPLTPSRKTTTYHSVSQHPKQVTELVFTLLLTNLLQTSCGFLTKFLWTSCVLFMKFLWISYKLLMNFLQTSYKLLTYFLWTYYQLPMNLLQTSYEPLISFLWTSFKLLMIIIWCLSNGMSSHI